MRKVRIADLMVWREARERDLVIATHDVALALAARGTGFRVIGI